MGKGRQRILVTGGAGFIGSHLVDTLVKDHHVTVLDNLSTGKRKNVNPKAQFYNHDIRDRSFVKELFETHGFNYVFHLAAQANLRKSIESPAEDASVNVLGSLNIAEECTRFDSKLIFSSSGGAIYSPEARLPLTEESPRRPASPYGLAKLTVENYLETLQQLKGLDFVALRYSNVYGPRLDPKGEAGIVSIIINSLLNEKELKIFGDGNQTRDFIHVSDVVNANICAMNLSGAYNVGTGKESSVTYLIQRLEEISGKNANIVTHPEIPGELRRNVLSAKKLRTAGWKPLTYIHFGLEQTFRNYL